MPSPSVLEGITVLDLSQGAAGPTAAMILGDYGAKVTKVDPPEGEWGRRLGPPFLGEDAAAYLGMNRNKRSIAVNLKSPEGPEIVRRLARGADVVLESFRPGVMARLGLGYEELSREHPELVYCAITAFGQDGPWRDKPGVDGIVQAMSGLMSITGEPAGQPVKVGVPAADMVAAMNAVQGILLALLHRTQTGRGQRVDVSLLQSLLFFQTVPWSMYLASGKSPGRMGSAAPYSAPNEVYPTQDGFLMVAAYWPDRWARLTRLLGAADLATDPRFKDVASRVENRPALYEALSGYFRVRSTGEWVEILEREDILCAQVLDFDALAALPHVMNPGRFPQLTHPVLGAVPGVAVPALLAESPAQPAGPAPLVGEHSRQILVEIGCAPEEIRDLLERGAVRAAQDLDEAAQAQGRS